MDGLLKGFKLSNNWLSFEGVVERGKRREEKVKLKSTDGSAGRIEIDVTNVKIRGDKLQLRLGSRVEVLEKPSTHPQSHMTSAYMSNNCIENCDIHRECEKPDTFGTGNVEFCCYKSIAIGPCLYHWRCKQN